MPSYLIALLWTSGLLAVHGFEDLMSELQDAKRKMFEDYDKHVRPLVGDKNTTDVRFFVAPQHVVDVDEERAMFVLSGYLHMFWEDPRLAWNITNYTSYIDIPADMVWRPDISIHNSETMQVDPDNTVLASIQDTGRVVWSPPVVSRTTCPELASAPYLGDVTCVLEMGSWMHDGWGIDFHVNQNAVYMDIFHNIHPRWEVQVDGIHAEKNVTYYECCDEPYITLLVSFPLRRRPVPEQQMAERATVALVLLLLASFWLPPRSSKRLLLGLVLFLAATALLVFVSWSTRSPRHVLRAGRFVRRTMYVLTASLLLQLAACIVGGLKGPSRPSPAVSGLLSGPVGRALILTRTENKEKSTPSEEWMAVAVALDRGAFLGVALALVVVHSV